MKLSQKENLKILSNAPLIQLFLSQSQLPWQCCTLHAWMKQCHVCMEHVQTDYNTCSLYGFNVAVMSTCIYLDAILKPTCKPNPANRICTCTKEMYWQSDTHIMIVRSHWLTVNLNTTDCIEEQSKTKIWPSDEGPGLSCDWLSSRTDLHKLYSQVSSINTVLAYGAGDCEFESCQCQYSHGEKMGVIKTPLEKETHCKLSHRNLTKTRGADPAAMVLCGLIRVPHPFWFAVVPVWWFIWYGITWATVVSKHM